MWDQLPTTLIHRSAHVEVPSMIISRKNFVSFIIKISCVIDSFKYRHLVINLPNLSQAFSPFLNVSIRLLIFAADTKILESVAVHECRIIKKWLLISKKLFHMRSFTLGAYVNFFIGLDGVCDFSELS
jgi:hypothetical protein